MSSCLVLALCFGPGTTLSGERTGDYERIRPLTAPSREAPRIVVRRYLEANRSRFGWTRADLDEIAVVHEYQTRHDRLTHLYLQERIGGIDVVGGVLDVHVAKDGSIVRMGGRPQPRVRARRARTMAVLSQLDAVARAAEHLGHSATGPATVVTAEEGSDRRLEARQPQISADEIPVRLVHFPITSGQLRLAWELQIRSSDGLHHWRLWIDAATGELLRKYDQIKSATYRVFAIPSENPEESSRSDVVDVAEFEASPEGWHFPADNLACYVDDELFECRPPSVPVERTTWGNNAIVQWNGASSVDGGPDLDFRFPLDLDSQQPQYYADATAVNAFYWVNALHDILYQYGFDEAAGNFQWDNFGRGGLEGDPVQVSLLDGPPTGGSFSTPEDGARGTMRVYFFPWTRLQVDSPPEVAGVYEAGPAYFGPSLTGAPVSGTLSLVDDGVGVTTDACEDLPPGSLSGRIALIEGRSCFFAAQVLRAEQAGATAAVVIFNQDTAPGMGYGGTLPPPTIPSLLVRKSDGERLKASATEPIVTLQGGRRHAALYGGLIAHEYAHGLSHRLVGGPSNSACLYQREQMGEGWSEFLALAVTAQPGHEGNTLRRTRFSTDMNVDPRTYSHLQELLARQPAIVSGAVNFAGPGFVRVDSPQPSYFSGALLRLRSADGSQVQFRWILAVSEDWIFLHGDQPWDPQPDSTWTWAVISPTLDEHHVGDVWTTMVWDMYWNLVDLHGFDPDLYFGTGGNNLALQLVIDGMRMTPCNPDFVEARDAILTADLVGNAGANQCAIWKAFARRGLGVSADAGSADDVSDGVEAFDVPADCGPCEDGLDNDGDGLSDYPADPDCQSPDDEDEASTCSGSPDADGDGVGDACDICTARPNGPLLPDAGGNSQLDRDGDGFGNACDCDFNQDGACSIADFNVFLPAFISGVDAGHGTDMNGDGTVGIGDFNLFLPGFASGVPGPSALTP